MSATIDDDDVRLALQLASKPLKEIKDTDHELFVGTWSLSKKSPKFRRGYGYSLDPKAHFTKLPFDVDGTRGIALIFWSQSDPAWYFTGWLEPHLEYEADAWIEYLNAEIARRHAGEPAQPVPNVRDGKAALDDEDIDAERRFQNSLLVKPFRPPNKGPS